MEISPIQLFQMLLTSFLLGGAVGILCDLYRSFMMLLGAYHCSVPNRKEKKTESPKVSWCEWMAQLLGDLLFFVTVAVGIVVINYTFNDGKMRIYTIFGIFFGYFIYRISVRKLVLFLLNRTVFFLRRVFFTVFSVIFLPFRKICSFLYKKSYKIRKKIKKGLEKKREQVYNIYVKKYSSKIAQKEDLQQDHKQEKTKKEGDANDTEKVFSKQKK